MSQVQTDPIFDAEGNEIDPEETPAIRAAREAADRGDKRADAAERRTALLELLPPIENKAARSMFLDSYKGEATEEAVNAALLDVGLIAAPADPVDPNAAVDAAAQGARSDLVTGALAPAEEPDPELAEHPGAMGLAKFKESKGRGATDQNASAEYFSRVIGGAIRGDDRVLHRGWTEEQLAGQV